MPLAQEEINELVERIIHNQTEYRKITVRFHKETHYRIPMDPIYMIDWKNMPGDDEDV